MKDLRQLSKGLSSANFAGGSTSLGWELPSEAASVRVGTFALVVGGVLSLVFLAF